MTMIFLYAAPILSGFSQLSVAAAAGQRATWRFRASTRCPTGSISRPACSCMPAFVTGNGPNDGWFNYVPYAARDYNPGLNIDFYALGMIFLGISTTVGAANFIVTLPAHARAGHVDQPPARSWSGAR